MILLVVILTSLCTNQLVRSENYTTNEILQGCSEESTNELKPVIWPQTTQFNIKIASDPLCLSESLELITRVCNESGWTPHFKDVPECSQVTTRSPNTVCPPGFNAVYENGDENIDFCYQFTEISIWQYPCLKSGSSSTIFDLDEEKFLKLISSIDLKENKHVWLPAKRIDKYGPLVWTTPGEKWEKLVDNEEFTENNKLISISRLSIVQNCLLLDLEKFSVKTENCSFQFPSLCVAEEEHLLQLHCPPGYFASQYGHNNGLCYGLQTSQKPLTWDEFHNKSCPNPISINNEYDNYITKELFSASDMESYNTCWIGLFKTQNKYYWPSDIPAQYVNWDSWTNFDEKNVKGAINGKYKWEIYDDETRLQCMICQVDIKSEEVEMEIKYIPDYIQLTIYNHQRLWRAENDDFGIGCFSNAFGFQTRISITEEPYYSKRISLRLIGTENESANVVEKIVYHFQPLNDQSGEYWCEGHDSRNFSLIKSVTLYVPAREDDEHIFVLKVEAYNVCETFITCNPDWEKITDTLKDILDAINIRLMLINDISNTSATLTFHFSFPLKTNACENISCRILITYQYLKTYIVLIFNKPTNKNKFEFIYLKSSEVCLPEYHRNDSLSWEMTRIGETVAPKELCMRSNGLPVTRKCVGSFVSGGDWDDVEGICSEDFEATNRTALLYSVAKGQAAVNTTNYFLVNDLIAILQNIEDIIPADIYFLGLSLKAILHLSDMNSSSIEIGDSLNIATAFSSVMNIQESNFKLAQTMNSSNMLLESIDMILSKIALNTTDEYFKLIGKDLAVTPQFVIQISCPRVNNISGLALVKHNNTNTTSFEDYDIIELTADMTLDDVLEIPYLDAATWISQELLDSLQYNNDTQKSTAINPRVVLGIFYNGVVFQETKKNKENVNSRIISISIPEYETELATPVYLVYRRLDSTAKTNKCAYWDLGSTHSNGEWLKGGCYYVGNYSELDICACLHLTHFAQLVHGFKGTGRPEGAVSSKQHGMILNAITMAGCSLSLLGVTGIAITAVIFPIWRHKPGSKILLQLSAALALQSIIMLLQDIIHPSDSHCIVLGVILHYAVLASFSWMLLTAVLQFARYVRVLGIKRPVRFMAKFSLLGWGLPIIPVAVLLLVDPKFYLPPATITSQENPQLPPERDSSALCYPQGLGLILCCLLPIASIVITNLIVFILVIHSVTRVPKGVSRPTDPDLIISQLRLSVLLFFLFGLSWVFGFLAVTGHVIIFSYLFCLTATLQGFVLFIYFIVCDPTTRVLWVSLVREKSISPSKSSTKEISIDTK